MDSNILQLIIRAVDNASGTIAKVGGELSGLSDSSKLATANMAGLSDASLANLSALSSQSSSVKALSADLKDAGDKTTSLGKSFLPASLVLAAGLGLAAKAAVDFDQQMELLHTQAGLSQNQVDNLKGSIEALAPVVGQGPEALATAFYHIASAGNGLWSTSQMLDTLKIAAEGAAIGQADLDDTTYALTSSLASGVKGASDAAQMMSVLNAIVGAGDMHMQDLNAAIGTGFLSTAASFGISIQSVGTALATLTDNGEHSDAAATRLRMTWALMAAPSGQATKQLEALGLTAEDASTATDGMNQVFAKSGLSTTKLADDLRQPNGMTVALQDLQTHLENAGLSASETDAMLAKAFGGGRTDAALLTMLQNLDRMNAKYKIIQDTTGKFASSWAAQQDQAKQKMADFTASVDVLGVKVGNSLLPHLVNLAKDLQGVATWFSNLSPHTQDMIVKAAAFFAVVAPGLILLGTMISSLGSILGLVSSLGPVFKLAATLVAPELAAMVGDMGAANTMALILQTTISTPVVFALSIVAALAALAYLYSKIQEIQTAIDGVQRSQDAIQSQDLDIIQRAKNETDPTKKAALLKIANMPDGPQLDSSTLFWGGVANSLGIGAAHNATGTNYWGGGTTWVGEQGPELVNLPSGSKVFPAGKSQQMASGGGDVHVHVHVGNYAGSKTELRTFAVATYKELQRVAKSNGTSLPQIGIRPS